MKSKDLNITYFLFVLPGLILYCFQTVIPVASGLYYSGTNWNGIAKSYAWTGLNNYVKAFGDLRFLNATWFSIRYTLLLIACVLVLSVMLGLLLNAPIRLRTFFRAVYFFPAVISMITIGLIFNQFYSRGMSAIAALLNSPLLKKNILSSRETAIYGILIANVWKSVSMPTILVLAGLQTIPHEITEASRLDGASGWQEFRHITVPFLMPIISIIVVLTLKEGLMIYDYIMALTGGGPAGSTESITLMIYRLGFEEMKFSYSIALSILVSVLIFMLSMAQIKLSGKKQVYD